MNESEKIITFIVCIVLLTWLGPAAFTGLFVIFDDHRDEPARTQAALYIQFVLTAVPLLFIGVVYSVCNFVYRLIVNK